MPIALGLGLRLGLQLRPPAAGTPPLPPVSITIDRTSTTTDATTRTIDRG